MKEIELYKVCPSCTWRGDVTLQNGVCPYCDTDWHKLQLAKLNERIERLEAHMQEAINNCETCHGSVDCARCKTFETDLKGDQ